MQWGPSVLQDLLREDMQAERPAPQIIQDQPDIRGEEFDPVFEEELNDLLCIEHHKFPAQRCDHAADAQRMQLRGKLCPSDQYGTLSFAQTRQQRSQFACHGACGIIDAVDDQQRVLFQSCPRRKARPVVTIGVMEEHISIPYITQLFQKRRLSTVKE